MSMHLSRRQQVFVYLRSGLRPGDAQRRPRASLSQEKDPES
jgi:hypothetical protein